MHCFQETKQWKDDGDIIDTTGKGPEKINTDYKIFYVYTFIYVADKEISGRGTMQSVITRKLNLEVTSKNSNLDFITL